MCVGILAKWLAIQCLKNPDELSEMTKMCWLTIEDQSNYYVQRDLMVTLRCFHLFRFGDYGR